MATYKDEENRISELRRQGSFRSGHEREICLGWQTFLEHYVTRLREGGMSENDVTLCQDRVDYGMPTSGRHLSSLKVSKIKPVDVAAATAFYAKLCEDKPWALPTKAGTWGGDRRSAKSKVPV